MATWKSLAKFGAVVSSVTLVGGYVWWQTGGILFAQAPTLAAAPPSSAPATATSQPAPPRGFMPGSKSDDASAWAPLQRFELPSADRNFHLLTPNPLDSWTSEDAPDPDALAALTALAASQRVVESAPSPQPARMLISSSKSVIVIPNAVPPITVTSAAPPVNATPPALQGLLPAALLPTTPAPRMIISSSKSMVITPSRLPPLPPPVVNTTNALLPPEPATQKANAPEK